MKSEDYKDLEEKYFLIKRNAFWAFCGGAVMFLAVAAIVSYKGAIEGIKTAGAQAAIKDISSNEEESKRQLAMIHQYYIDSEKTFVTLSNDMHSFVGEVYSNENEQSLINDEQGKKLAQTFLNLENRVENTLRKSELRMHLIDLKFQRGELKRQIDKTPIDELYFRRQDEITRLDTAIGTTQSEIAAAEIGLFSYGLAPQIGVLSLTNSPGSNTSSNSP
jgi:hypothetical protein